MKLGNVKVPRSSPAALAPALLACMASRASPDLLPVSSPQRVSEVTDSWWHSMLILPPLLKESPSSPFLAAYYPDCVGMSPSGSPGSVSLAELRADPCRAALCVRPDMMELDELYEFPEFSRDPTMYLALRNLILASWHRKCTEVLTAQRCAQHIVVRGLVRVRCVQELDRVLRFMTRKGLINTGVLAVERPLLSEACCAMSLPRPRFPLTFPISPSYTPPVSPSHTPPFPLHTLPVSPSHIPLFPTSFPPHTHTHTLFPPPSFSPVTSTGPVQRKAVVVVGAGASGLAAARQLHNFGFQMGLKMHKLGERCDLFQEGGQVADPAIDKRMDFHFNAILDVVSEWRKDKSQSQDRPLGEKVQEVKKNFLQESGIQFSALEEKVLQFHLSNLEYACGSTLDQVWKASSAQGSDRCSLFDLLKPVSARSWDHNEFFAQFSGDHTLLTRGYSVLLNKLAEGLEIHRNCPMGLKMHKLGERCDLVQEGGQVADPAIDKRMDFHFNAILDVVSEWRKDKSQSQDRPLGEKVQEVKKNFLQESGIQFSALEEKVLQFHLSNLEYACGSTLDQVWKASSAQGSDRCSLFDLLKPVSARSWDHNEFFAQFSGDHTLLTRGYSVLLNKLAEGLEIHRNCPIVNGCVNNPIALMCEQVRAPEFWIVSGLPSSHCGSSLVEQTHKSHQSI
ncbi:unnamed protein product [Menidia menidia]|uniref:(Atlantic silverside) hypothetical protein n=1 Tax=Menidia menidia TaxID=238744 RepID=A0A8S4BLU0_9TELE|nr:unnamed protein product [Menidia menidia]